MEDSIRLASYENLHAFGKHRKKAISLSFRNGSGKEALFVVASDERISGSKFLAVGGNGNLRHNLSQGILEDLGKCPRKEHVSFDEIYDFYSALPSTPHVRDFIHKQK